MNQSKATYNPAPEFQWPNTPGGHMIAFWGLGNWLFFMAGCSINSIKRFGGFITPQL